MILFVNNGWAYRGISGGDLHVIEVASRWSHIQAIGIAMPQWAYQLHAERLRGIQLLPSGLFEAKPPRFATTILLRYLLRSASNLRARSQLVVAASHYPYDLIPATVISRKRRVPLVVYVFHLTSMFRKKGPRAALTSRWENISINLLRQAIVLADNDDVVRELISRGLSRSSVLRTWNAPTVKPDNVRETRRRDEVVFCHRIADSKGWQDLVVIGERLREKRPGTCLRVLGDGPRRSNLERALRDARLSDVVRVEGFVDEETKWSALQRCAVFISTSREEGWGIAVGEALAAGAPVVGYDLPVYREVHGERGMHLVPSGDVEKFADTVVQLLNSNRATDSVAQPSEVDESPTTWDQIAHYEHRIVRGLLDANAGKPPTSSSSADDDHKNELT